MAVGVGEGFFGGLINARVICVIKANAIESSCYALILTRKIPASSGVLYS